MKGKTLTGLTAVEALGETVLRECFAYSPSGRLYWSPFRPASHFARHRNFYQYMRDRAGREVATTGPDGQIVTRLCHGGVKYGCLLGHHIVWCIFGRQFEGYKVIDHINRNPADNRIENLRLVPQSLNCWNRKTQANNTSGVKGVSMHNASGLWRAQIAVDRKQMHLGYFSAFDDAVAARKAAELRYYGEFAPA